MFILGNECKAFEKADVDIINNIEKAELLCNKQCGFKEVFRPTTKFLLVILQHKRI